MSKRRTRKPARATGKGYLPLLVVGSAEDVRARLAEVLAGQLDAAAEHVGIDHALTKVESRAAVGVAVYAPRPDERVASVIERLRRADASLPVVLAGESIDAAEVVDAYRAGVQDVWITDRDGVEVLDRMRGWIQLRSARAAGSLFGDRDGMPRFLGAAAVMQESARLVERVAPSDATVLILGESGTGKELVARAIHEFSRRRKGPFIAINCAAIPDTLLENELFGHEKGSYTGASSTAIGKVEAAEKGTLFLDEIGDMPIGLQAKILRLLQDKSYDRIGGTSPKTADIRIVTATNRNLKREVEEGRFREDLYYRLSVVPITLPALRDRAEDIPLIARDIVGRLAGSLDRPGLTLEHEAMERLVAHRWPGNVRELENELERAAVMTRSDEIGPGDLELKVRVEDPERSALASWIPMDRPLDETCRLAAEKAKRLRVSIALEEAGGDKEKAADALGVSVEDLETG